MKWKNDDSENADDEKVTWKQYNGAFFLHIGEI